MTQGWTGERKANHLEFLTQLNSSKEHQDHLKRLNLNKKGRAQPGSGSKPRIPIEVVDTITQEKIIYPSISEAARAIELTKEGISLAFKRQKAKGVDFIFVKNKRYRLKIID